MPVTKLARTPIKAAPAVQKKETPAPLSLPDSPKEPDRDVSHYLLLLYGREKIGKTTWLSSFPEAIYFSTEPGAKGLSVYEFNHENGGVKNWDIFRSGVDLLEKNPGRFKTVVIDTVDRAYDMCLDWVCENRGIEYPGHDSSGEEDFGKSWRAVKMEFLEQIHRIVQTGRGICFTSHAKEEVFKTRSGDRFTRIYPTMSKQARGVIEAIVDMFFYAEYIRGTDGQTQRILICQGDETIWAGARETIGASFPQFLPLEKKGGYDTLSKAFLGEFKGIDPGTLVPSKTTTETAKDFIRKAKTKVALANG